jgi:hypothetical protein
LRVAGVQKLSKTEHLVESHPSKDPEGIKRKVEAGYSMMGIASGLVMKLSEATSAKTCGLFVCDWP